MGFIAGYFDLFFLDLFGWFDECMNMIDEDEEEKGEEDEKGWKKLGVDGAPLELVGTHHLIVVISKKNWMVNINQW